MKKHMLRNMFIAGSTALALAASAIVVPSVADAKGYHPSHRNGPARGNFRGPGGRGYYGGNGYYGGYCPVPIPFALFGACGPWSY